MSRVNESQPDSLLSPSLPFSRVLSTVANTCPVGTRDTVIQAEADEYSRVALRCNVIWIYTYGRPPVILRHDS